MINQQIYVAIWRHEATISLVLCWVAINGWDYWGLFCTIEKFTGPVKAVNKGIWD